MACRPQKFFFEAATIRFGREHSRAVTAVADVAGSLDGTYFDLNGQDPSFQNESQFVVAANTDPSVPGKTTIIFSVANDDSAETVAASIVTAINGYSGNEFRAKLDPDNAARVCIENRFGGAITAESDSGSTGFTFDVEQAGIGTDLGKTSGAVELTITQEVGDVVTNQTGSVVNSQLLLGSAAELSASFVELDQAKLRSLFVAVGDELQNPLGDYLIGAGTKKLFSDLSLLGGQLCAHPQRLPINDYSRDLIFWSSAPKPDSLNFDGSALQELSTTFTAYVDERYKEEIRLYAIGDWTNKNTVDA